MVTISDNLIYLVSNLGLNDNDFDFMTIKVWKVIALKMCQYSWGLGEKWLFYILYTLLGLRNKNMTFQIQMFYWVNISVLRFNRLWKYFLILLFTLIYTHSKATPLLFLCLLTYFCSYLFYYLR